MPSTAPTSVAATHEKSPLYDHPPLVEVTLSVQWSFAGTFDVRSAQELLERLGPTWQQVRPEKSTHSGWTQSWNQPATMFQSVLGEQRLEASAEGFEYAWDGRSGEIYPHYESVRDAFVVALDAWNDWAASAGLAPPVVSGWKVSYLNRIPQGTVWNSFADCTFFRLLPPAPPSLPRLERCEGRWQFALNRDDAALLCELKTTAGTAVDPRATLWLRLACSGGLDGHDSSLLEGLDYGRQVIVNTFRQLMSPAANAYWELQGA